MRTNLFKMTRVAILAVAMAFTFSCSSDDDKDGGGDSSSNSNGSISSPSSSGGGNLSSSSGSNGSCSGGTVKIGTQTWQKCDVNITTTNYRCLGGTRAGCDTAKLYDWEMAHSVCPSGFHLPTKDEWATLIRFVESDKGCTNCAGKHLKSESGWRNNSDGKSGNGLDSYGFSALSHGYFGVEFTNRNDTGYWWSASNCNYCGGESAVAFFLNLDDGATSDGTLLKVHFASVRCLQD